MKKIKNILTILLIFLITITITIMSTVNASFNPDIYKPGAPGSGNAVKTMGETIVGVVQVIGMIVSVIVLIALGIKYMMGSVEEKASYKKSMVPYIVGAVMLFAASSVAQFLYEIGMKINEL